MFFSNLVTKYSSLSPIKNYNFEWGPNMKIKYVLFKPGESRENMFPLCGPELKITHVLFKFCRKVFKFEPR